MEKECRECWKRFEPNDEINDVFCSSGCKELTLKNVEIGTGTLEWKGSCFSCDKSVEKGSLVYWTYWEMNKKAHCSKECCFESFISRFIFSRKNVEYISRMFESYKREQENKKTFLQEKNRLLEQQLNTREKWLDEAKKKLAQPVEVECFFRKIRPACFKRIMVGEDTASDVRALCPKHQDEVKRLVENLEELEELEQVKLTSQNLETQIHWKDKKIESVKVKLNEWVNLIGKGEVNPKGWWWW